MSQLEETDQNLVQDIEDEIPSDSETDGTMSAAIMELTEPDIDLQSRFVRNTHRNL